MAGLLITLNLTPLKTPVISMPFLVKMAAVAVTVLGLLTALELASLAGKQFKPVPHHPSRQFTLFSNMLGFFPMVIHRVAPKLALALGQAIATQMLDQTWLEKVGPKSIMSNSMPLITSTSNAQRGTIKTYLTLLLLTLIVAGLASIY